MDIMEWERVGDAGYAFLLASPFVFVLGLGIQRRYFSTISDIPGPFLASLTILWQIWQIIRGRYEQVMIREHQKNGYFVRISPNEVSVSHPDAIRAILLTPLRKADWYKIMALPDHHHQTPMSEVNPKRRVERAKNVASGYALSNIIKSEPYIDSTIELLEKRWDELSQENKPVEFDKWFNYMAFDIVGEVTFSSRFGFLESGRDIGGAIANSRVLTLYVTIAGYFQWLHRLTLGNPLIAYFNLTPSQHIFDTCLTAVNARRKNPNTRMDMMEQWLGTLKAHPDRFEEKELHAVATATIGAGADTISATLQAFWYNLLRQPQHLSKLRAEIDSANAQGKLSKVVSYAEAQDLPFLQACIKETFRYHAAVAFGLTRVAGKEGVTIGDRHFSEGTHLSVNPWVIHRSVEFFGPDAHVFNPERWLEPRGKDMEKYMVQFGAGYNSCPGRNLANLEVSKVAATLARDFDIRQVDPKQEWSFESHFTAVPYGWPCYVQRRNAV